jgi:sulfur carrier protein
MTMNILINDKPYALPDGAMLTDALTALNAAPPFAVAVNREFVPRSAYAARALQPDDRIEVIRPVTGG